MVSGSARSCNEEIEENQPKEVEENAEDDFAGANGNIGQLG